jgi:hypothetical protein
MLARGREDSNEDVGMGEQVGVSRKATPSALRPQSRIGLGNLRALIGRLLPAGAAQALSGRQIRYHLDIFDHEYIYGWALHRSGIGEIRVFCNDRAIGRAEIGIERPDVYWAFPDISGSYRSGFRFPLMRHLEGHSSEIRIEIEARDGTQRRTSKEVMRIRLEESLSENDFRPGIDVPVRSGFPFEITKLLCKFRAEIYEREPTWTDEQMAQAVDDLTMLWQHGARSPSLNRYALFLKTMQHRFHAIRRMFPNYNRFADSGAKDWLCVATSPDELVAIANQLYVLKSNGLHGYFLEFGCFKGYSSCCLSFCCHQLGLPMEIFDSFAGLPASDSTYYSVGEFCGSLAEVSAHIQEFGEPRAVNFHKGYFSETLPHFKKNPNLCIWMDVDLFSSARDVAQVLDRLPRASVVFTHEFPPDGAQGGRVIPERSEVFPPILDRFASLGRSPVGRHVYGWSGAIWDASEGIPVIPTRS